jgi:iron complex outermembrane receptor protein
MTPSPHQSGGAEHVQRRHFRTLLRAGSASALAVCCAGASFADEVMTNSLEEISVTAVRDENRALQPATILDEEQIERLLPTDFTEVFRSVMGVGIRTNSRGEAVLRLRGSEERQSQVFIDGAPISVPWDGRPDLSLFPASFIRNVSVIKSAAPIEFGANAVLGVVDISTLESGGPARVNARSEFGSHGAYLVEGEVYVPTGDVGLQFGANHFSRDALTVASRDPIPFDPLEGEGRTNTDLTSTSFFAAAALEKDWGTFRLSAIDIEADKGIAAAAHIDPDESSPRCWRYPDWHMTQLSLAGDIALGDDTGLRLNAWHQRFEQQIVSYSDISYSVAEDRQDDRDRTYGGRMVLSHDWQAVTTRLVTSLQESTHTQVETDLIAGDTGTPEQFRQRLLSIGGEVDIPMGETVKSSLSLAYDRASTPLTGGRPSQPAISNWAAGGATAWQASDELTITATLGLRTRFPTMRELYGTALGRFLLTFAWMPASLPLELTITPWFTRIDDTLSQRNVQVDGVSLRQRYNIDGSRGLGIEAAAVWHASAAITLEASAFWQDLKAELDEDGNRPTLYQRPKGQLLLAANYSFTSGASMRAEVNHTGHAFDENEDGSLARLSGSTELNLKFYVPVKYTSYGVWQIYGAVNNITDTVVLPQLGLPDAGRSFKLGIRLTGD